MGVIDFTDKYAIMVRLGFLTWVWIVTIASSGLCGNNLNQEKMTHDIDYYMLNKTQQISDRIQDWIGVDNFLITKVLASINVLLLIFRTYILTLEKDSASFFVFLFGLIVVSYPFVLFLSAEKFCKENPGFMNPTAVKLAIVRIGFPYIILPILCIDLLVITSLIEAKTETYYSTLARALFDVKQALLVVFLYFGSCTPKPRKTSKVGKFIKTATESVNGLIKGTPSPSPSLG